MGAFGSTQTRPRVVYMLFDVPVDMFFCVPFDVPFDAPFDKPFDVTFDVQFYVHTRAV